MGTCRCGVADWRALRHAVGLNQQEMARLLAMSESGYRWLERQQPHRCPRASVIVILRLTLLDPEIVRRLALVRYPIEHVVDPEHPGAAPAGAPGA